MRLRLILTFLSLLLVFSMLPTMASAAVDPAIPLFLNNKELKPEVAPRIVNNITLVPIRIVSEELGSKVSWEQATQKITIEKNNVKIEMNIGQKTVKLNGNAMELEAAPMLAPPGTTLVPVRFIGEGMGMEVNWNSANRGVYLNDKVAVLPPEKPVDKPDDKPIDKPGDKPGDKPTTDKPVEKPFTDANGKVLSTIKSIELTDTQFLIKADTGTLKPNVFTLSNPNRLVIDIPDTVISSSLYSNAVTMSGEIISKNPSVEKIRYALFSKEPYSVRIVLDLKESFQLQWDPAVTGATLSAFIKKSGFKVVIDAGHGDHDPGAKATDGHVEKEFNLSMAQKVYALLQKEPQIQVMMTRSDDTFVELDDRAAFANENNAELFVSIHGNSYLPSLSGTETYYYKPDSLAFAKLMHRHLTAATGLPDRGVRQQPFRVVKATNMPAILLEVGYLSNTNDAKAMFDEAFQNRVAASIVAGIKEQLNIK